MSKDIGYSIIYHCSPLPPSHSTCGNLHTHEQELSRVGSEVVEGEGEAGFVTEMEEREEVRVELVLKMDLRDIAGEEDLFKDAVAHDVAVRACV